MWSDGIVRKANEWVRDPQLSEDIAKKIVGRWHSSANHSQRANVFFGSLENVVKVVEERLGYQIVLQGSDLQAELTYQETITPIPLSGTEVEWFLEKLEDEVEETPPHVLACMDRFCCLDGEYYLADEITQKVVNDAMLKLIKAVSVAANSKLQQNWAEKFLPELKRVFSLR